MPPAAAPPTAAGSTAPPQSRARFARANELVPPRRPARRRARAIPRHSPGPLSTTAIPASCRAPQLAPRYSLHPIRSRVNHADPLELSSRLAYRALAPSQRIPIIPNLLRPTQTHRHTERGTTPNQHGNISRHHGTALATVCRRISSRYGHLPHQGAATCSFLSHLPTGQTRPTPRTCFNPCFDQPIPTCSQLTCWLSRLSLLCSQTR